MYMQHPLSAYTVVTERHLSPETLNGSPFSGWGLRRELRARIRGRVMEASLTVRILVQLGACEWERRDKIIYCDNYC